MTKRSTAAEIDARVAGLTIPKQFLQIVAEQRDLQLLKAMADDRERGDGWDHWTTTDVRDITARAVAGLQAHDVHQGERVLLMMRNRPDFHWFDLAVQFLRATPVSIYNSSSAEEIQYLSHHAEAEIAIREQGRPITLYEPNERDPERLAHATQIRSALSNIHNLRVVDARWDNAAQPLTVTVNDRGAIAEMLAKHEYAYTEPRLSPAEPFQDLHVQLAEEAGLDGAELGLAVRHQVDALFLPGCPGSQGLALLARDVTHHEGLQRHDHRLSREAGQDEQRGRKQGSEGGLEHREGLFRVETGAFESRRKRPPPNPTPKPRNQLPKRKLLSSDQAVKRYRGTSRTSSSASIWGTSGPKAWARPPGGAGKRRSTRRACSVSRTSGIEANAQQLFGNRP